MGKKCRKGGREKKTPLNRAGEKAFSRRRSKVDKTAPVPTSKNRSSDGHHSFNLPKNSLYLSLRVFGWTWFIFYFFHTFWIVFFPNNNPLISGSFAQVYCGQMKPLMLRKWRNLAFATVRSRTVTWSAMIGWNRRDCETSTHHIVASQHPAGSKAFCPYSLYRLQFNSWRETIQRYSSFVGPHWAGRIW